MTQEQRLDILLEALLRERPDRQDIPAPPARRKSAGCCGP